MTDVAHYIQKAPEWARQKLQIFHNIMVDEGLTPALKWGAPMYVGKRNVVGMAAFKNHVSLWFHQGVFLKDAAQVLVSGNLKTKGLRQWRFSLEDLVNASLLRTYIKEAIANDAKGLKTEVAKTTEVIMPEVLKTALANQEDLQTHFFGLSKGRQKEYCTYILEAKKLETQIRRTERILVRLTNKENLKHKN